MKAFKVTIVAVLIVVIVSLGLYAYFSTTQIGMKGRTLTDLAGREVLLPLKVKRIVSLDPEATRTIIALGAGDRLVGVTTFDKIDPIMTKIYPRLKELPAVGRFEKANIEEIVSLKPDVIFYSLYREPSIADEIQERTGTPVVCGHLFKTPKGTLSYEIITQVGKVLGKEERAKYVREFLERKVQKVLSKVLSIPKEQRAKAYATFARDPLIAWGYADPIESAGAINVALNPGRCWYPVNIEQLMVWDPDIIIVHFLCKISGNYTVRTILSDPEWQQLRAVRDGKLYVVAWGWAGMYPATITIAVLQIAKASYPDLFRDLNLDMEGNEIYKVLYGADGFFNELAERFDLYTGL